jgi:hypothetical protein
MASRHTIIKQARDGTGRGPAYLVYDFNQRHTPQFKQTVDPTTHVGVDFCAGLALEWLALRRAGKDYDYDEQKEVLTDPGDEPMQVQRVYLDQGHAKAFDKVGLKEEWNRWTDNAVQPGPLLAAAAQPGMYFLQIRHTRESGHAVAFTTHGWGTDERAVNYFDANLGAFYFGNRKQFQDWFDWVLSLPLLESGNPPKPASYEDYYADHWTVFRLAKG